MKQFYTIKAQHPDALLLFRMGDFYETFGEDAVKTAGILGITLTRRGNGTASEVELAGFPYHSLDLYLPRLVSAGLRVAICEQLEDPKLAKTIVKRGIKEIVSPGTNMLDKALDATKNNFLACIHFSENNNGIALLDLGTGEFLITEGDDNYVLKLVHSFLPSEIIVSKASVRHWETLNNDAFYTYPLEDWLFSYDYAEPLLTKQLKTQNLKGFGIEDLRSGIAAAGVILHYLSQNKYAQLSHVAKISRLERNNYLWLDKFTIRNLELLQPIHEKGTPLYDILNHTKSPMGARLLKKWMAMPLRELTPIQERLKVVEFLVKEDEIAENIGIQCQRIGDLERLTAKVSMLRALPREILQLKQGLQSAALIKNICAASNHEILSLYADQINPCPQLIKKIETTLKEDAPATIAKGGVIQKGVHPELDELRDISFSGKDYLVKIQKEETEKTGISSLKIGFNNVFGYYLEVTNVHKDKVPETWVRKQTLTGAERYITDELKQYEEKILHAEERILALEKQLFDDLVLSIAEFIPHIQQTAETVARLDCLVSFASAASRNNYIKPELDESLILDIQGARHPVIEKSLPLDEAYIPNDVYLDNETQQIIILTGPNMSGKSAILRQTALIVLMAQMGSFVPATAARIGLVDKIFTRVGASDNLSVGESTFMVEMTETASILNNLSQRSLILLDEIGRGTSTYDGVSIAWAITEFLHNHTTQPKTLFATHYHELNEIAAQMPRVRNFHVSIQELQNKIVFLRKMVSGGSEHSFGIHVAQMSGVPATVISRANDILVQLESGRANLETNGKKVDIQPQMQLKIFDYDDSLAEKVRDELKRIDINTLTPVEALMKLNQLKNYLKKNSK